MRPAVGESAPARKTSISQPASTSLTPPGRGGGMSFMLASEADLEQRESGDRGLQDSNFGIRSIADGSEDAGDDHLNLSPAEAPKINRRPTAIHMPDNTLREDSRDSPGVIDGQVRLQPTFNDTASQPLTPMSLASHPFEFSVPGSPKSLSSRSFRHSDDDIDGSNSHAIASSEDEADTRHPVSEAAAQQLIMPSLIMPSRRPFTDRGRQMGKLRVLVAGSSCTGKTSLIKSIIQTCEDIIHVDASSLQVLQSNKVNGRRSNYEAASRVTTRVTEIYTSTKAHPGWWIEADGSNMLQRRRSIDESVLARNLCFVDTPGYDRGTSILEGMEPALKYIENQMQKSLSMSELSDTDLLSVLSGHGGMQVDVVLYVINHDVKPSDLEYIRQLNLLSNVLLVLSKADTLDESSVDILKCAAIEAASEVCVLPPLPGQGSDTLSSIYAVCSCPSTELDTMDASVLMQSEYMQPLQPSELPRLIDSLFDQSNVAYLKHAAAGKLLAWRTSQRAPHYTSPVQNTLSPAGTNATTSTVIATRPVPGKATRSSSHTSTSDDRVTQLRLAALASSLQRNLAYERRRYEALARGERVAWLRAQLHAYSDVELPEDTTLLDANLSAVLKPDATAQPDRVLQNWAREVPATPHPRLHAACRAGDAADPLGLLRFRERCAGSGWLVLQVAGSCGLIGAVTVWALH